MSLLGQIPIGSALGSPLLTEHQVTVTHAHPEVQIVFHENEAPLLVGDEHFVALGSVAARILRWVGMLGEQKCCHVNHLCGGGCCHRSYHRIAVLERLPCSMDLCNAAAPELLHMNAAENNQCKMVNRSATVTMAI
jgi:hypothetical protein